MYKFNRDDTRTFVVYMHWDITNMSRTMERIIHTHNIRLVQSTCRVLYSHNDNSHKLKFTDDTSLGIYTQADRR